ncbi:carboxymuconolactone decarboxylase family protein [Ruegeria sediminis]|uniref:Carboxymuconolactone decarboxylase family protein n=1 Tax=Ruegeria sediminis TaxID=2583820 RepID=A0ABY2WY77_9RHOB|nr:carboxymuconolactone decarboxylase family protein [Ruegeria sediminis]TMV07804.1 carboxymuconolactone decarboxylase family protein [Ruegeria sediminis]
MPHLPSLPDKATLFDVYRRHPAVAQAMLALNDAVMRQPSPFTPAEREAIAAYVSALNDCQYCHALHGRAAVNLGMEDGAVAAICERPEAPEDPRLIPVLAYVARLTSDPASVGPEHVRAILDAGWTEDAVSFAAFIAATYALMNRVVEGHGIRADEAQADAGGARLAGPGYAGIAQMLASEG